MVGLLLDSTREQTIQTQIQLNSKVTTRESAALLPYEQNNSSLALEKTSSISINDGCPAQQAQVVMPYHLSIHLHLGKIFSHTRIVPHVAYIDITNFL